MDIAPNQINCINPILVLLSCEERRGKEKCMSWNHVTISGHQSKATISTSSFLFHFNQVALFFGQQHEITTHYTSYQGYHKKNV
jgi:hypothetical protein